MPHLPAATVARTGRLWGNEAALEPSCDHLFRTASFQLANAHERAGPACAKPKRLRFGGGRSSRSRKTSEVLRVALKHLEPIAALVLALEGDFVAGAADRLAVLVLVGILEADPLALERRLALGDRAAFQQGQRAVLAVVLEDHLAIDLA